VINTLKSLLDLISGKADAVHLLTELFLGFGIERLSLPKRVIGIEDDGRCGGARSGMGMCQLSPHSD
jgi:hypothetical protein